MMLRTITLLMVWVAAWTAAAGDGPTPVDEKLETVAVPRVIHAGRITYAFSPVTGAAIFAAEYLTPDALQGNVERGGFRVDRNLPEALRVSPKVLVGTGYDAGHLAPAKLHRVDEEDQAATSLISNTVPMVPEFNRGIWRSIELAVEQFLREGLNCWVVTVALYEYRDKPMVFAGGLPVPTRVAKALIATRDGEPVEARAWIAANQVPARGTLPADCLTTIDAIEDASQLELFSWLDDETESRMEATKYGP